MVLGHVMAGVNIGKNIATPKPINRLFGVANHKESDLIRVSILAINRLKNLVLLGVGVLKFINHRDRQAGAKLLTKGGTMWAVGVKRPRHAMNHVIKTDLPAPVLGLLHTRFNPRPTMRQNPRPQRR